MGFRHNCSKCENRCDGRSKGVYKFNSDAAFSEAFEQDLIAKLCAAGFKAIKTERKGYPDIEVYNPDGSLRCFIEVKAQRRSFMSVGRLLPNSGLIPSETLALNLSDLVRYFEIAQKEPVPVYLLWVLSERPCIVEPGECGYYYRNVKELENVFKQAGETRQFRRKTGYGDVVNGKHLGVTVNYHYSLEELKEFKIADI